MAADSLGTGGKVEAGAVQPALDVAVVDISLGQLDVTVAALVEHRVDRATAASEYLGAEQVRT